MKNLGFGEPLGRKAVQERPRHPAPLTATANHSQPAFANLEPKTPEAGEIAGYGVIVEVALNHTPQPFPDFRQRLMHPLPKRDLHLCQLGDESLRPVALAAAACPREYFLLSTVRGGSEPLR